MMEKINLLTHKEKDLDDCFLICFGEVNNEMAQSVTEWVFRNNFSEQKPEILTLLINSAGGDLNAAWAIIDVIRGSDIPVRTIGLGQIASAGLLIFTAGKQGMRILTENTSIMSHQYYFGTEGKHHELIAVQKELSLTHERMIEHFKKCTGMKRSAIMKNLLPAADVYLTAQEAKELGICDHVRILS